MSRKTTFIAGVILAAFVAGHAPRTLAIDASAESSDRLEAACVFNFLRFAEWPQTGSEEATEALTLAVVGRGSVARAIMESLNGKSVHGRNVVVIVYPNAAAWMLDGSRCQALFVAPDRRPEWPAMKAAIAERPILTIADWPGFCAAGGMLNLYEKGNRIRFDANPSAVSESGLKLHSGLLKLARIVRTEETGK